MANHTCGYHCPCAATYDQRNTARGGSTRKSWPAPTVRDAVILPEFGRQLKAAKLRADAEAARLMTDIEAAIRVVIQKDARRRLQDERRAKRQQWRAEAAKVRPAVWPEIRRAVSEWWANEKATGLAAETIAAGVCITAFTAAVVVTVFGMGVIHG